MAEVIRELVMSGIWAGVSVAVAGGLLQEEETVHADGFLDDARRLSTNLIEEQEGELAPWQQILVGEIVGMSVAARTQAGTLEALTLADAADVLRRLWEFIDRL